MMKTNVQSLAIWLVGAALLAAWAGSPAAAQYADPGMMPGMQPAFSSALPNGALDGPIWVRYTPTTDGLGFDNSYTTIGGLMPFWNAPGDALWFCEAQGHLSSEGRFFGNFGFGRRVYESGMRRTFGLSAWFDYDGDRYSNFGHDFQQAGVNFDSFGDMVDLHINGYFPFRDDYILGDGPCFFENQIMLRQGIDSALRGCDAEAGIRLPWVQQVDPRFYIGGYAYGSSAIEPFIGVSSRIEVHPTDYTTAQLRLTDDDRFGTSVIFGFELHLGGRRHRPAYDRITEPVHRNDHIVRYHQDPLFAIDPNTGLPIQVVHVDANAANPGTSGTFERPFTTLLQAENNSGPGDVILVYGAATYNGGILLKDSQRLIGTGFPLVIRNGQLTVITAPNVVEFTTVNINGVPVVVTRTLNNMNTVNFTSDPRFTTTGIPTGNASLTQLQVISAADVFQSGDILLCNLPNTRPVFTNPGGAAVTLANFNEVANIEIRDSQIGIFGNGVTGFNIHNNLIAPGLLVGSSATVPNATNGQRFATDGILLTNVFGNGSIRNNQVINTNRPNPPVDPNVPFSDGMHVTVTGDSNLNLEVVGNLFRENDTGVRLVSDTTGVVNVEFRDNIANNNVNDGVNILKTNTGTLNMNVRGTGLLSDPATGLPPVDPLTQAQINIPSAQLSFNGDINKVTDNNGNGRGLFLDALDGFVNLAIDRVTVDGNDSSFFPRYGALQFNLEPGVDGANIQITNNTITRTGFHVLNTGIIAPPIDSFDSGSAIRLVSNPGFGVTHVMNVQGNTITDNFSDGIKVLMLTEGLRTAALPDGTLIVNIQNNQILRNQGIEDDNGGVFTLADFPFIAVYDNSDISDDFDSPTADPLTGILDPTPLVGPFQGLDSNPDPKNEFTNNINGSGIVVRAKGTDNAQFFLAIRDNTIADNAFDAINMAFAGRGNIDYVPGANGQLTPVQVFNPFGVDPITGFPISVQSPDTFGVNAHVLIDNNIIRGGPTTGTVSPGAGISDDLIKVTILDGADVAMQVSNNSFQAGPGLSTGNSSGATLQPFFFPAGDLGADTALEIDTWDTSNLMLVVDNNDVFDSGIFSFNDGGFDLHSHDTSIFAMRITRNRLNDVNDSNNLGAFGGAAINLLAEGNSQMIAFVNNNDINNPLLFGAFFEATTADNARLCLQLLDNTANAGSSPQGNQVFTLTGDAFYLVQTENSIFELEPTRGTNHEDQLPESQSITTYTGLLIAPPGAVLPPSTLVQFGNVPTGNTQACLNALLNDFPFSADVVGFGDFDPPVIHP